jgi:hypothetical protein
VLVARAPPAVLRIFVVRVIVLACYSCERMHSAQRSIECRLLYEVNGIVNLFEELCRDRLVVVFAVLHGGTFAIREGNQTQGKKMTIERIECARASKLFTCLNRRILTGWGWTVIFPRLTVKFYNKLRKERISQRKPKTLMLVRPVQRRQ